MANKQQRRNRRKPTAGETQTTANASVWLPFSLHVPSGAGGVAATGTEADAERGVVEAWLLDAQIGYSQELPPDQKTIPATKVDTKITTVEKTANPASPEGFCIDTKTDAVVDYKADPPNPPQG